MTRLTAPLAAPASLWEGLSAPFRGLSKLVSAGRAEVSGLDALEREHARIRLTSRHWLM